MTFHFAHMAPPGAPRTAPRTSPSRCAGLAGRWVLCPLTHRLVMLWDRPGDDPAIPAQHEPVRVACPLTGSRAA
ncbi:MAG: hypothetical protein ACXIU8_13000 [Alkalilacustris sp.]